MARHLGIVATLLVCCVVVLRGGAAAGLPKESTVVEEASSPKQPGEKNPPWQSWTPCPATAEMPPGCPKPKDCAEVQAMGYSESGVYTVYVGPYDWKVDVYCDMDTNGGGWLVFQRRHDGFTDFYRPWNDYADGFGNLHGEFWLGNHFINLISQQKNYKLRVDLDDFDGASVFAEYTTFKVAAPYLKYKLEVDGYSLTSSAGDSMEAQNGQKFSTYNQDNDIYSGNCASSFKGGWWYSKCHSSNLNGLYLGGSHTSYANGVNWAKWKGYHYSLKTTVMMMRPQ